MVNYYLECLSEISLKKYQELVVYSLRLEAKVNELTKIVKDLSDENQSLTKKIEAKSKRSSSKDNE